MKYYYPIFKEYDSLLNDEEINKVYDIFQFDESKFKIAEIRDRVTNENKEDKDTRQCKEIYIDDKGKIKQVSELITPKLNSQLGDDYVFNVALTNMRIIEYEVGDFFAKHTDFVHIDSNMFKSYSLLICLDECDEGGETVLYVSDEFTHYSSYTSKKRGGGLIFPKKTVHEGNPIKKGKKRILFLSYDCFPSEKDYVIARVSKHANSSDHVNDHVSNYANSSDHVNDHVSNYAKLFVIPTELLMENHCTITDFYLANKQEDKHIYYYDEDKLTSDEFDVFYQDLFDKSKFDFGRFEEFKDKMEHLCYKFRNAESYSIENENGYDVFNKEFMEIIKNSQLKPNQAFFKVKVHSIMTNSIVEYVYLNDKFIFCNPNVVMDTHEFDYRSNENGFTRFINGYGEDNDRGRYCEICDTEGYHDKSDYPYFHVNPEEEYWKIFEGKEDCCDLCINCVNKCYKSYLDGFVMDDEYIINNYFDSGKKNIYKKVYDFCIKHKLDLYDNNLDDELLNDIIENGMGGVNFMDYINYSVYKYHGLTLAKDIFDKIKEFKGIYKMYYEHFEKTKDESNIGVTIDFTDRGGAIEYNTNEMVDINKEVKVNEKFMNFYKCYSDKVDEDKRQALDEKLLERFNHFEFISKIIYDKNFTNVKQDTGYIYCAKSERGVEYQEVIREGIVDLSKFQI